MQGAHVSLFNPHALVVIAISCTSVALTSSAMLDIGLDTYLKAFTLGAIWPVINTIKQSYTRREKALKALCGIKASVAAIYWTWRDYSARQAALPLCKKKLLLYVHYIKLFLKSENGERRAEYLTKAYQAVCDLSLLNYEMCKNHDGTELPFFVGGGFHDPSGQGAIGAGVQSRVNQYIRFLVRDFESMRVFKDYRTPAGLRYLSSLLLHVLCVMLGPFYNSTCPAGSNYGCLTAFFMCFVFGMVIFLLYRVQQELEEPFDGEGYDDVRLQLFEKEMIALAFNTPPGGEYVLDARSTHALKVKSKIFGGQSKRVFLPKDTQVLVDE